MRAPPFSMMRHEWEPRVQGRDTAQRPRPHPPGGSDDVLSILAHSGGQGISNFPHASRVSLTAPSGRTPLSQREQ